MILRHRLLPRHHEQHTLYHRQRKTAQHHNSRHQTQLGQPDLPFFPANVSNMDINLRDGKIERNDIHNQRRSQKSTKGGHGAQGGRHFPTRGAPLICIGAPVGAIWAYARERGSHFMHLGASLMPMVMGAPMCKRGAPYESHVAPPSSYRGTALRDNGYPKGHGIKVSTVRHVYLRFIFYSRSLSKKESS